MRNSAKYLISFVAFLALFAFEVRAQKLSSLPQASEIVTGVLPNGITFYIITNTASTGYADFALVQKGHVDEALSRDALAELPHFQKDSPCQFLAKLGVSPEKFGYVRKGEYRFSDVPVSEKSVCDTTLLMLFDLSARHPYEQAVIVSGDVKVAEIRERMNVFSMMVTPRIPAPKDEAQVEIPDGVVVKAHVHTGSQVVGIRAEYASPRTPKAQMKTVLPLVTEMFARELDIIVRERLARTLRQRAIPVAGIDIRYHSSAESLGPESFTIGLITDEAHLEAASRALADVLAGIDKFGATADEYADAKEEILGTVHKSTSLSVTTNSEYLDRCSAAFLYGASLASRKAIDDFLSSRDIPVERETELFNNYASALLSPSEGLTLSFDVASEEKGAELAGMFVSSWENPEYEAIPATRGDTLSLSHNVPKVKLKATASEPVTGGQMWTFSNGMRVIWRRTATPGCFSYALMLNDGATSIPSISQGQCGFVSDILSLCDVAGLAGPDFSRMLRANGISMSTTVGISDMRISGSAPVSRMELLLKSLLSLSQSSRAVSLASYRYYRDCEQLRIAASHHTEAAVTEYLDSLLCPDYVYTSKREPSGLTDELPTLAGNYFESQFSHCQGGVLVLVGDIDQFELKKVLSSYLGGFGTSRHRSLRPQVAFNLRSGTTTYTSWSGDAVVGDGTPAVDIAISTKLPYTMERKMSFRLALTALKRELVRAAYPYGMSVDVTGSFDLVPSENVNVKLRLTPVPASGLPSGVEPADPLVAISAIRTVLDALPSVKISSADLKAWKASLAASLDAVLSTPEGMTEAAMTRYSLGKDIVSGRKDKLAAVNESSVREVLTALSAAGRVEYIVY